MKLKNSIIFAFIFLSLFFTHQVSADGSIFIVPDYDEHVIFFALGFAVLTIFGGLLNLPTLL